VWDAYKGYHIKGRIYILFQDVIRLFMLYLKLDNNNDGTAAHIGSNPGKKEGEEVGGNTTLLPPVAEEYEQCFSTGSSI